METPKRSKTIRRRIKPALKQRRPIPLNNEPVTFGKVTIFVWKFIFTFLPSAVITIALSAFMNMTCGLPNFVTTIFAILLFIGCVYFFHSRIKAIQYNPQIDEDTSLDYVGDFNHLRNPFATTTPSGARCVDTQTQNTHFQEDSQRSSDYYNHYHDR